ncbi:MAG: glycosyltransferase [Methanobacteriaceae archaeon]|nr:glycosyltransferase [Methanobacteriaceae archaeon]
MTPNNFIKKIVREEFLSTNSLSNSIKQLESKTPNIYILSKNESVINNIKKSVNDLDYNIVGVSSNGDISIEDIKKLNIDLIFISMNLNRGNGLNVANRIIELDIPIIYILEENRNYNGSNETNNLNHDSNPNSIFNSNSNLDYLNNYLIRNYGFILENYDSDEIRFAIDLALKKHAKDLESLNKVKNKFKEKANELVIEKLYSVLLLVISITLIVSGVISRNVTFIQWIIFIPSVIMLILAIVSLKKQEEAIAYDINPFVSIIIPAHNEEFVIEKTIRSILNMDYKISGKDNFELIVVNDGSNDRTADILAGLSDEFDNLKIMTRKAPKAGKGKGFVLNDALVLAKGDIIGVFDSDTQVCPDYLNKLIPYLNNDSVVGVQSRVRMYNKDENFLTNMQDVEFSGFGNILRAKDIVGFNGFLGGNGQFVKKDAIINAGKWDGFAVTEDLNLSVKLALNGGGIRYCGDVAVYQEAVTNWDDFFKQRVRWAIGNFETLFIYSSRILSSKMSIIQKIGMISHISIYLFNLFIFIGFIIFLVNMIGWFILDIPTVIRMEAPLIIGIVSAIAFFPGIAISLFRDDKRYGLFLKDLVYYWFYCFHLIPLFFKTMYTMILRKERRWSKTEHKGDICEN